MRIATCLFLIFVGACAQAAQVVDSCQRQIPETLSVAIEAAFPGYRTPLETDNSPDDVEYNKKHGGSGCLNVAVADFNGDHKQDYLLGLTAVNGPTGLAVIALSNKAGWKFQKIQSWTEDARIRQYVEAVKPGKHYRTQALDGPLNAGEKNSMRCSHWGAMVGMMESTGIVYCYQNGRWPYVWVSD